MRVLAPAVLVLLPVLASAQADSRRLLDPLTSDEAIQGYIEQNRRALGKLGGVEDEVSPARIWIHARSAEQGPLVDEMGKLLEDGVDLGAATRRVEMQPVQLVETGPTVSQVRYFRAGDAETARQVADQLAKAGWRLQPRSLVEEFADVDWIDEGHIEIWLSEKVERAAGR